MRKPLFIALLICLLISGSGASHAQGGEWSAASVEELELRGGPAGSFAILAPDGEKMLIGDRRKMCIANLKGEAPNCTDLSRVICTLESETMVWSPDSTKVAFHEDLYRIFDEPDIWTFDARSGVLLDLTPDTNRRGDLLKDEVDLTGLDIYPVWAPDSRSIIFVRYSRVNGVRSPATLYRLGLTGKQEKLGELNVGWLQINALALSPDGQKVAYSWWDRENNAGMGLWIANLDGSDPKQLFRARGTEELPINITFSPDGRLLLFRNVYDRTSTPVLEPERSAVRLISVEGGEPFLIDEGRVVRWAGFSPDGTALAYLSDNLRNPDESGLYITSEIGKPGKLVVQGRFFTPTSQASQPIIWGATNVIVLSDTQRGGQVTVITLEKK